MCVRLPHGQVIFQVAKIRAASKQWSTQKAGLKSESNQDSWRNRSNQSKCLHLWPKVFWLCKKCYLVRLWRRRSNFRPKAYCHTSILSTLSSPTWTSYQNWSEKATIFEKYKKTYFLVRSLNRPFWNSEVSKLTLFFRECLETTHFR